MKVKIDNIRDKIFELEWTVLGLKNAIKNEERKSAKEMYSNYYSHQVEVFNEGRKGEFIVITFRTTKSSEDLRRIRDEHNEIFESAINLPEEMKRSSEYYRKHGVLFSRKPGFALLKENVLCSDEEWKGIKAGNIKEFINN